ncbi:DNA ligase 1-like, partial [Gracilinanus agilis]|uniref:DNA ligase 1-like n=1 Tax=Gracilinanus agilis TaxID=191870 RepID=UPI001CFCD8E8
AALKERNSAAMSPESESPVKRPARKVARALGSEGEEDDEEVAPHKQEPALPSPVVSPAGSGPSDSSPSSISPAGIPKRRTARKQMQKRKLQETSDGQKDGEPKRLKKEGGERAPAASQEQPASETEPEGGAQTPQEASGEATEPEGARGEAEGSPVPKAFSSFFAPRKPAAAKQPPKETAVKQPQKEAETEKVTKETAE